jgi:predicted nucleotidyltransferase
MNPSEQMIANDLKIASDPDLGLGLGLGPCLEPSISQKYYDLIQQQLKQLEVEYDITILLAVENGSRLTGLWHDDSDYDIRFVFSYNRKAYNTAYGRKMMDLRDTIEGYSSDRVLDWQGWCIDKAIESLKISNPSIIEWVYSDIIYISRNDFLEHAMQFLGRMHNVKSLYYHYLNMAKKNWELFIKDQQKILYKKYLYVMRPLLMLMYIQSDGYDILKTTRPIINNYYDLLEHVKQTNESITGQSQSQGQSQSPYRFNPEMLQELDRMIQHKKTDKTAEGPPLAVLDVWIEAFFEYEMTRDRGKNQEHKNLVIIQALRSTRDKLQNEIKKINALSLNNEYIKRTNYLSLFGQFTMFVWLIQHPDKQSNDGATHIGNLLKEITIDPELKEWIHEIVVNCTKNSSFSDDGKISETTNVSSCSTDQCHYCEWFLDNLYNFLMEVRFTLIKHIEYIEINWNQDNTNLSILNVIVENDTKSNNEPIDNQTCRDNNYKLWSDLLKQLDSHNAMMESIKALTENCKKNNILPRDDIIDYCFKNYFSFLWLLKSDQNPRNIPKDVFSDKDAPTIIDKDVLDFGRKLLSEMRPVHMTKVNKKFHESIEQYVSENESYVNEMCAKYARKKEIDKQSMFRGSCKSIDPNEFLEFFERYAY